MASSAVAAVQVQSELKYASLCDGIGAVHVAWKSFGWKALWTSEIEKFPMAVVEHHWHLPNLGDMTQIQDKDIEQHETIDLLVGGTPCQSFSVAGLRKGLADVRGNLALRFCQLAAAIRPTWLLWENVPGVLSIDRGRAFGTLLGALAHIGYGFAYGILDAQYFGVPQRRRRVFVVGHLGDWRLAAAVLFERESLSRNPPPSREAGAEAAHTLARGACGSHGRYDPNGEDYVIAPLTASLAKHEGCSAGKDSKPTHLILDTTQITSPSNYSTPKPDGPCHPLASRQHPPAVAYGWIGDVTPKFGKEVMPTLRAEQGGEGRGVAARGSVRRLTPRECERLQGFPDDYTCISWRGKPAEQCPDGPRYRALGNSMAVPVMKWIGQRIATIDRLGKTCEM